MDSNCLAITLNWGLANSRSNSPSTRGCGDRMQTFSFVLARFVVTFADAVRVVTNASVVKTGLVGKGQV